MATQVRSAIVLGGTGYVGAPVVRRLLAQGASVIVPSRSADSLNALRQSCTDNADNLVSLVADVSSPSGAEAIGAQLGEHGGVDLAVAAIGGWWEGAHLADLPYDTWTELVAGHLTAHFLAAQAVVPYLRVDAAYVTLNGIAALQPEAGSGPISVTGAAQAMLLDVFRAEAAIRVAHGDVTTRWHEVCVVNPIVADGDAVNANEAVVEIGDVVDEIVRLAQDSTTDIHRLILGEA